MSGEMLLRVHALKDMAMNESGSGSGQLRFLDDSTCVYNLISDVLNGSFTFANTQHLTLGV